MARYALTIFTSAFLLFGVQPLVGKYALPWFGGTAGVWAACMLFFQALLLAGYAYAHASATRLTLKRQAQVHLTLLAVTVGVLALRTLWTGSPVTPGPEWRPEEAGVQVGRLLLMLAATVGLPFFVLSTTGPLLQSWFSRANPGVSPYRLYALSNVGSLLSLLSYPFAVEPFISRGAQGLGWGAGFLCFAVACAVCALQVMRLPDASAPVEVRPASEAGSAAVERPGVGRTLAWLGLSACASVLLLASTNQLSQDVAAGPFLWVMPLALYLITFIIAFEREALYSRAVFGVLLIIGVWGMTSASMVGSGLSMPMQVLAHGTALFAGCMVCHGELYRLRPAPRHLSTFYLWVSVGGVVGGGFVSLLAPNIFSTYLEYPLALGACCLVVLGVSLPKPEGEKVAGRVTRVLRIFLLSFVMLGLGAAVTDSTRDARRVVRNFFGVVQVREVNTEEPLRHLFTLRHGVIIHGIQYVAPERRNMPTAYYTPGSGLGLAMAEQRRLKEAAGQPPGLRIGVLGLGVGASAAMAKAGDTLRFYEINPVVISLAQGEGGFFSYLKDTPARVEVVEGDARISLEQELARGEPQRFDVLTLDVFSSDSIPAHLLTEEAMAVYQRHLAPNGVLALHVSNNHVDLVPVVAGHAERLKLDAALVNTPDADDDITFACKWVVLSAEPSFAQGPSFQGTRSEVLRLALGGPAGVHWTDDLSSVLPMLRQLRQGPSLEQRVREHKGPPVAGPTTP
ncbi:fused MFS/spermidine synthase [Myxococcaceae bacterium GXIMD 01537]